MNELIERVQEQLDNNWAVDAKDIQSLINEYTREVLTAKVWEEYEEKIMKLIEKYNSLLSNK